MRLYSTNAEGRLCQCHFGKGPQCLTHLQCLCSECQLRQVDPGLRTLSCFPGTGCWPRLGAGLFLVFRRPRSLTLSRCDFSSLRVASTLPTACLALSWAVFLSLWLATLWGAHRELSPSLGRRHQKTCSGSFTKPCGCVAALLRIG